MCARRSRGDLGFSLRQLRLNHSRPGKGQESAMGKKIFVGNLSFSTTSAELESLFAQVGTCESATVVTDRDTGRSRGFGFVEMSSASEAGRAITEMTGRNDGRRRISVTAVGGRGRR